MNITFKNENTEKNIEEAGRRGLESRREDFIAFSEANDLEDVEDVGSFYDYGLCIDYVVDDNDHENYLRYQLSWGGPADEIRFYFSPGADSPYRIEYVFLDWFCGIGFDVTGEDWAQWLWDWFYGAGIVEAEVDKAA